MKKLPLLLVGIFAMVLPGVCQQTDTVYVQPAPQGAPQQAPQSAPERGAAISDASSVYEESDPDQAGTVRLGIRFAPGFAFNSAVGEGAAANINSNGAELRLSGGLNADFFFTDQYAFATGLWYTIKRSSFQNFPYPATGDPDNPASVSSTNYNLQYLQVPVSLKLYTNEVAPDLRMYFQLGGTLDIKLAEKAFQRTSNALYLRSVDQDVKVYRPIDVGLLLGFGTEFQVSEHNALFATILYNRGLVNAIKGSLKDDLGDDFDNNFKSVNSLLSLEIGVKF